MWFATQIGLKIGPPEDKDGWTEFAFPSKRSTLSIHRGISLPPFGYDFSVATDWHADSVPITRCSMALHRLQPLWVVDLAV
jgi:hypothetical protein